MSQKPNEGTTTRREGPQHQGGCPPRNFEKAKRLLSQNNSDAPRRCHPGSEYKPFDLLRLGY